MEEEIKRLKNLRKTKLAAFTRKQNSLKSAIEVNPTAVRLKEILQDTRSAFSALEKAHEDYVVTVEEEVLDQEGDYLSVPQKSLDSLEIDAAVRLKALESEDQYLRARLKFKHEVENFGSPSKRIVELSAAKEISFVDMRAELTRIEASFDMVKAQLMLLDPSADHADLLDQYNKEVVEEYERCKTVGFKYMKDVPSSTPPALDASATGSGAAATVTSPTFSSTKRETVMLPKFSGDEKSAFLQYPVWKKQWESHITEYETKYRATMLLNHLDDKAKEQIVGLENEYEKAIESLDKYYNDAKKIVKACLDEIRAHSTINSFDYKALVAYKKCLVNNFTRLQACDLDHELSNTAALGVLVRKLPIQEAVEWQKYLAKKDRTAQSKPFPSFLLWLEEAGASWELLAASGTGTKAKGKGGTTNVHHSFYNDEVEAESDKQSKPCFRCGEVGHWRKDCKKSSPGRGSKATGGGKASGSKQQKDRQPPTNKKFHCALHKGSPGRSCYTWSCAGVKYTPFEERIKLMKLNGDCEMCCGDCPRGQCQAKFKRTCGGGKDGRGCGSNHLGHELWCDKAKLCFSTQLETVLRTSGDTEDGVLLQIMKIPSINPAKSFETVLWDSACSAIFVRHDHAQEMNFPFREKRLRVSTLGGHIREIDGTIYRCTIRDLKGNLYEFEAHGLDEVTGEMGLPISKEVMKQMFPDVIGAHSMSGTAKVDYLIGLSQASWQPKRIQKALGGGDFWLWENAFGNCLGGSHPMVNSCTARSDSLYTVLKTVVQEDPFVASRKIPTCSVYTAKVSPADCSDFFNTEQLGTVVEPKCGSCRCGKCPVPGSRYSFREETELQLIEEKLRYDDDQSCWIAEYPYLFSRDALKGNRDIAIKSMLSTERTLGRNPSHGKVYQSQIEDMISRGVARIVPEKELEQYAGPVNYLPHLAALNPRSESTPVRICFDASRAQGGGPSLNQVLAKGPDRFINNLAGVIINFRNGRVAAKGDVKKMYNAVKLVPEDAFMQCFMWRNLDPCQHPKTYQVTVNNIGVKPAGAIATLALRKSTEVFDTRYPVTARQLREKSYVDDLGLTARNQEDLKKRTLEADIILKHANMRVKKWTYSGDNSGEPVNFGDSVEISPSESLDSERMLGVTWDPIKDVFCFKVTINLSPLKQKSRMGPDLTKEDLVNNPPSTITRRQYYSQVQSLFDPIGFLAPVLLRAKVLLRRTWEGDCGSLKWDDPLPEDVTKEMVSFFIELFDLETLDFPRSLWPREDVVGKPDLIVFSDGSVLAFGTVAYVRWTLKTGGWWTALIMSKSKVAPKNRITIPRLELNGAVLAKRVREFVMGEVDMEFENVYHMVDSSTVLGYLHKADSKLKPFEGTRVSEIQTAGVFEDGRLKNWSWVEGERNPADWATKPRGVLELAQGGFWQQGPTFLRDDVSTWPIKLDFKQGKLDGELLPKNVHVAFLVLDEEVSNRFNEMLHRVSSARTLFNTVARIFSLKTKTKEEDDARAHEALSVEHVKQARRFWIQFAQKEEEDELRKSMSKNDGEKVKGKYRRLSVFIGEDEIWRVGSRILEFAPFTSDKKPPAFLPTKNRLTTLLMQQAHNRKHASVEETVAQFRMSGYWTPQAAKLAKIVKSKCVICRFLDKRPLNQLMGQIPKQQLSNPMVWSHVETDLFGPFTCRSDVNKRSSIKVWGIVIVDKVSGAVHCDIVMDYSAQEIMKALRRFASIRGWPVEITSDPGSQLVSASDKLESWWETLKNQLSEMATNSGFSWRISPANSPWRQGRCEVRIKCLKRLLIISVGARRLSPVELQTYLFEAANLSNERPLGIHKVPNTDGSYLPLTPNSLLMGRSQNLVPDDSDLACHMKKAERYQLVQEATGEFWSRWSKEITPESVIRQKWHETCRNLQVGDIVLIHEKSPLKGKYVLGRVESVKPSADNLVRSCEVGYTLPNPKDPAHVYSKGRNVVVTRSIQRLTLLLPVEEQKCRLQIIDNQVKAEVDASVVDRKLMK